MTCDAITLPRQYREDYSPPHSWSLASKEGGKVCSRHDRSRGRPITVALSHIARVLRDDRCIAHCARRERFALLRCANNGCRARREKPCAKHDRKNFLPKSFACGRAMRWRENNTANDIARTRRTTLSLHRSAGARSRDLALRGIERTASKQRIFQPNCDIRRAHSRALQRSLRGAHRSAATRSALGNMKRCASSRYVAWRR